MDMTILLEPMPKGRPRISTSGDRLVVYTPHGTAGAEHSIRVAVMSQEERFTSGALKLDATFYRVRPKSLPKKQTLPVTRPDLDNYLKLLTDALNKYLFTDDAQITTVVARKRFGDPPRIEFSIEPEIIDIADMQEVQNELAT